MRRQSWIIQVGPKSNYECPYKTHIEERQRREGGNVTAEAEIGVMRPQAKEHLQPQEAGRGKEQILP